MGNDIEFDRQAVGVVANQNWTDAEEFGRISAMVLNMNIASTARPLPAGDNAGTSALATSTAILTLRNVIAEFGDAAAILGSGVEDTIADFDSTEYVATSSFAHLEARLGGGPMRASIQ